VRVKSLSACKVTHLIDVVVYAAEDKHLRTKAGARVGAARAARAAARRCRRHGRRGARGMGPARGPKER